MTIFDYLFPRNRGILHSVISILFSEFGYFVMHAFFA